MPPPLCVVLIVFNQLRPKIDTTDRYFYFYLLRESHKGFPSKLLFYNQHQTVCWLYGVMGITCGGTADDVASSFVLFFLSYAPIESAPRRNGAFHLQQMSEAVTRFAVIY